MEPRSNFTVMIVEDQFDVRYLMRKLLQMRGFGVAEAVNGQEAVNVARQTRPDLILMDLHLPLVSGFEVTRQLREDAAMRNVPIVALSAYDRSVFEAAALHAGCDEYLTKPLTFDKLDDLLTRYLPRRGA